MLRDISESDWKIFRQLRELALERFCERVLDELVRAAKQEGKSSHQRYLAIYKLIEERDEELADAFENPRRSAALLQLAIIRRRGLLTDEDFARFSDETRKVVEGILGLGARD